MKVKIKSLAAEAKIIRLEEAKVLNWRKPDEKLYQSLRTHRVSDVRKEQRAAMLAYGFLRGKVYGEIERKSNPSNPPDMTRVKQLVEKFGGFPWAARKVSNEEITAWKTAATERKEQSA